MVKAALSNVFRWHISIEALIKTLCLAQEDLLVRKQLQQSDIGVYIKIIIKWSRSIIVMGIELISIVQVDLQCV